MAGLRHEKPPQPADRQALTLFLSPSLIVWLPCDDLTKVPIKLYQ